MSFVDECPTLDQIHDLALHGARRAESRLLDHVARCRECSAALSGALLAAELSDARPGPSRRLVVALSGTAAALLFIAIGFSLRIDTDDGSASSGGRETMKSRIVAEIEGEGERSDPMMLHPEQRHRRLRRDRGNSTPGTTGKLDARLCAQGIEKNPDASKSELFDALIYLALDAAREGRSPSEATATIASRIPPGAEADYARGIIAWLSGDAPSAAEAFASARNDPRLGAAALFNAARASFHAHRSDDARRYAEAFYGLSIGNADLEPWAVELAEVLASDEGPAK